MAQEKSSHSTTTVSLGKVMRRTFCVGIPATAMLSGALAVVFAVAIDGGSGSKSNQTNTSAASSGAAASTPAGVKTVSASTSQPAHRKLDHKKKLHKHVVASEGSNSVAAQPLTAGYADSVSGVSFRYPPQYTLVTPAETTLEGSALNSELLGRVPMNFVRPGGMKVATVAATDSVVTPLLEVNLHHGLTAQQCEQFADPDPAYVGRNLPLDPIDETLPLKVTLHGIDFMRVDNGTDQTDTRYYHHFENGNCYEFVLAVVDKSSQPESIATTGHRGEFYNLERIMTSVEIKSEAPATTSVLTKPNSSKQQ